MAWPWKNYLQASFVRKWLRNKSCICKIRYQEKDLIVSLYDYDKPQTIFLAYTDASRADSSIPYMSKSAGMDYFLGVYGHITCRFFDPKYE